MKRRWKPRGAIGGTIVDDRAPPNTEWFWRELELLARRWDPLGHRFYTDWICGRLALGELALYAEEFDHLVAALETGWGHAARKAGPGLHGLAIAHAAEEAPLCDLWRVFAGVTGWDLAADYWYGIDPYPATRACASIWSGDETRPLVVDLLTLYVIETTQRGLAPALLHGLQRHHAHIAGDAAMYFRARARDSRAHAIVARAALQARYDSLDPSELRSHALAAHRAYWEMLDSIADSAPS